VSSVIYPRRPRPGTLAHRALYGWHELAACQGEDPYLFFGPERERPGARTMRETIAKAICAGCPVRAECLEYALELDIRYGVWGGLGEDERKSEQRRRARRAAEVAS